MCITPDYFPDDSFLINTLHALERETARDGSHEDIIFTRHVPHKLHFPKMSEITNALGTTATMISICYPDEEKKGIFRKKQPDPMNVIFRDNDIREEYASECLLAICQLLCRKNPVLKYCLAMPSKKHFGLKVYRIVLDTIIDVFVDHLLDNISTARFKEQVEVMENKITDFILKTTPAGELLNNQ